MNDYCDNDDYNEELTEEELEENRSASEAIIRAEHDSVFARQAWENTQQMQEGDGFMHLT